MAATPVGAEAAMLMRNLHAVVDSARLPDNRCCFEPAHVRVVQSLLVALASHMRCPKELQPLAPLKGTNNERVHPTAPTVSVSASGLGMGHDEDQQDGPELTTITVDADPSTNDAPDVDVTAQPGVAVATATAVATTSSHVSISMGRGTELKCCFSQLYDADAPLPCCAEGCYTGASLYGIFLPIDLCCQVSRNRSQLGRVCKPIITDVSGLIEGLDINAILAGLPVR
ncbi:hypothetical protein MMPV_001147 [Pyropia vietnamensis]